MDDLKITPEMKENIMKAFEEQLDRFAESSTFLPMKYMVAFPLRSDQGDNPWLMGFTIERPIRNVPQGPSSDRFSSGYTQYYGIKGDHKW